MQLHSDTIVAISTPAGSGAIGVIRLSGPEAIDIAGKVFSRNLEKAAGHTLHYGNILKNGEILDEAVAAIFIGPRSYTKEDVVEFSCHGSPYILREVLMLLVDKGARLAQPGEFTQRAYLNGAMDLAQAEAVADLIASTSAGAHQLAMNQMRGGISRELKDLREQLLNFTSLIELELDFGEEDVEFADRTQLSELVVRITERLSSLIDSFQFGNAIKQGVPTVIMGKPNAGKSTLLNTLLNENRAIVSDIPGTTRDVIEDRIVIQGIEFRLMDTAGVRETVDQIEAEGVSRTLALAQKASLVIYIFDRKTDTLEEAQAYLKTADLPESAQIILLGNKSDLVSDKPNGSFLPISAKAHEGIDQLRERMVEAVQAFSQHDPDQAVISNVRHLTALRKAAAALEEVQQGLEMGITGDLLAIDIRTVLHYIGEITGEISTDEVLGNIFSRFCIGK
ncbi:MAG: tRNA uridine-5-carboxymethylaminomethyl(34) synthesis GTPase MnmE [Bacteroidetes bacterium]|nr:tRNA uridine-5-carboxymethylaminomethyl(34) synthesis GTPase MnmE [Bacteroidota bacterium]